jgi:predicted flap endonuclease-1-like 5' DNA nuclease
VTLEPAVRNPTFNWTVNAGTISSPPNQDNIVVDVRGLQVKAIVATVEVGGLDPKCPSTAEAATELLHDPKCPTIIVDARGDGANGQPIVFVVSLTPSVAGVRFSWNVTGGTIRDGQTAEKVVIVPSAGVKEVTATVQVFGLPPICPSTASKTVPVTKDNLTVLKNIGPARVKALEDEGIKTFADLAAANPDRLKELFPTVSDEDRASWITEAKKLSP